VHSLQIKFGAFIAALLIMACATLGLVAARSERIAHETEASERGRTAVVSLAAGAAGPLRSLARGDGRNQAALEALVAAAGAGDGVVDARLLDRNGRVLAAIGAEPPPSESRRSHVAPIGEDGERLGEARIVLDHTLVPPAAPAGRRQRAGATAAVLVVGLIAGLLLIARLVGPLKRLRHGLEELSSGNVMARVPPTSRDEIGQLTRAFNEMGDALAQKQRVETAFGRYVDDYVLAQLLESTDGEVLTGVEREATVLFADIRSFTRLSEGLAAQNVVALLNEIFQLVSDCILEQGGTIDKFIGDSVMAYFGAPVPHPDHAQRAVKAAMQIIHVIDKRNRGAARSEQAPIAPVQLGIGVHLGQVVVGNIGSDRRTDFTAVGDAVNVAHRLEKLAQPGQVLVSEVVQRRVRGAFRLRFEGERQLSGREEPVHVYAVEPDGGTG